MPDVPHVVIVGGGFGGLWATRSLGSAAVRITLVDRCNHHLFQPLLYQVATAGLSAPDIAAPLRHILRRQHNVTVLLDEVTSVEPGSRSVALAQGGSLDYDYLLLAPGARHAYFGHDDWAAHAPGLKTLEDALGIRRQLLTAFERKVEATLDALDGEAEALALAPFAIGHVALGCALGYLDYRFGGFDWRARAPRLSAWYAMLCERPSFARTVPVDG